jgi:ATP-dependent DNA ligase
MGWLPLIARRENGIVHLWSHTGRNWAKDFPLIGAAMARLPVGNVILDGEAVSCGRMGDRTSTPCVRATPAKKRA